MKKEVGDLVGRTITAVVHASHGLAGKHEMLFLVLDNGAYFEFWGESFSCSGGARQGGLPAVHEYARRMNATDVRTYSAST